jgi:hypothetical protein
MSQRSGNTKTTTMSLQPDMSKDWNQHGLKVGDRIRDRHYGIGTIRELRFQVHYGSSPLYFVEFDKIPTFRNDLCTCGGLIPSGLGGCVREDYSEVIERI